VQVGIQTFINDSTYIVESLIKLTLLFSFSEVDSSVKAVSSPAVCTIPTVVGRNVIPRITTPHNSAQGQPHLNGMSNITKNVAPKRSHSPSIDGTSKRLKDVEKVKFQY
jgi:hypothetical protein